MDTEYWIMTLNNCCKNRMRPSLETCRQLSIHLKGVEKMEQELEKVSKLANELQDYLDSGDRCPTCGGDGIISTHDQDDGSLDDAPCPDCKEQAMERR